MKNFFISFIIFCCLSIPATWYFYAPNSTSLPVKIPPKTIVQNTLKKTDSLVAQKDSSTIKTPAISMHEILYSGFASNEFKPQDSLKVLAKEWLEYLQQHPSKKIIVTGHTDDIGEAVDNKWIGMQRAKSVARYLQKQGFTTNQIEVKSMGETQPLVPNTSKENRRKNRRIEIDIQEQPPTTN